MTDSMSEPAKYTITEEERERRRQAMKKLHEEGRAGPQFGKLGGRPRKPRATELAAQKAAEHADEIVRAFRDGLKSKNPAIRLNAAKSWLEIESKEHERKLKEERALESLSTEELVEAVSERFAKLAEGGFIDLDGSAVEEVIEPPAELGTGDGEDDEQGRAFEARNPARGSGTSPFSRRTTD